MRSWGLGAKVSQYISIMVEMVEFLNHWSTAILVGVFRFSVYEIGVGVVCLYPRWRNKQIANLGILSS